MAPGQYTHRFSDYQALLPYSVLGILAGICSAGIILVFEFLIVSLGALWLGDNSPDDFEALSLWQRFALPVLGAVVLGLLFSTLKPSDREVGIVHVLSRMHSHYGHLPMRNALVQMIGGAIALATGQSGGREGPGIHLGAAINSSIAYRLGLPNNSQRILIACGTAGGIAVAFNTPLAGVIFAMEVIIAEYTVVGFTPVILAAISATTVHHAIQSSTATFAIPPVELASLLELPFILLLGICAGTVSSLFIYLMKQNLRFHRQPVLLRFACAGLLTGSLALFVPQVLGMGYDSVNSALLGELAPMMLLAIIGCKLLATACSVGLGLPVGLIGPNLLIGGCLGGLLGYWGGSVFPGLGSSDPTLYVVIGMGAAMAAVLNAPLAAILAVVELTHNVLVVFPSMLAIIAATLTTTIVFKQRSAHQTILRFFQKGIPEDTVSQLLHQTNVLPVMDRDVAALPHLLELPQTSGDEPELPRWCLLQREGESLYLVQGTELANLLAEQPSPGICDLTELDLRRWSTAILPPRCTLREAMDTLRKQTVEAIVVTDPNAPRGSSIRGIITRDIIEQFYLGKI
jgi:CIC family chloride channel protein